MNRGNKSADPNRWTFTVTVIGIVTVLVAFVIAVVAFHATKNPGAVIPAVVGVVATAVGTLVGAVVGHAAGAQGKDLADQRAASNQRDATAGIALAQTLISGTLEPQTGGVRGPATARLAPTESQLDGAASSYADLARSLFPDL